MSYLTRSVVSESTRIDLSVPYEYDFMEMFAARWNRAKIQRAVGP